MDTNPAQTMNPNTAKTIIISDIQLHTEAGHKVLAKKYYVKFSVVGNPDKSTKTVKEEKHHISWDEKFFFDGDDHTVFVATAYKKHRVPCKQDELVGSLTDTIGGILGKLENNVFEKRLQRGTSNAPEPSGATIKFALVSKPHGDANATEFQAMDAVNKAREMTKGPNPIPEIVGLLDSVNNTGANVIATGQSFENTWGVLFDRMKWFNDAVAHIAEVHPYASLAWSVISAANKVLINQKDRDDQIIRLAGKMSDVFTFVQEADPLKAVEAHKKAITPLLQQVAECGYFITEYSKQKNFWIRTAKYTLSDIDGRITDYENKLQELKTNFLEGVTLQSGITVFRMINVVEELAVSVDLKDMPYAAGARYMEEKGCLPGTRESLIQDICDILNDPAEDAPRVCLITGMAGSGKSAIAHSIARLYDGQERLGSSFCFLRSDLAKRNPQNFFSTISRDLAGRDAQFRSALWRVVKDNPALRMSTSPLEQVKQFIIGPSKEIHSIGPLIVVVDALDESGTLSDPGCQQFLKTLSDKLDDFPRNLRFLITTRPERDILDVLPCGPHIVHKRLGDVLPATIDEDISKFVHHSLHKCSDLDSMWPNEEWCRLLVKHSQGLFQWASAACKFINGRGTAGSDPSERLEKVLQTDNIDGADSLDKLYLTILCQLFESKDTRQRFHDVMAIVLAFKEPLSLSSLSALFGHTLRARNVIKPLGSLLDGALDEERPIRPLHTSFRDFLQDGQRSSEFYVNTLPGHSLFLGEALLASMRKMLKFNICDLKDSRIRNHEIPDLPSRVTTAIPPHLAYACQYWMDHLQHTECTNKLLLNVTSFFKPFFPFWLEAISLLSHSSPLTYTLSAVETCNTLVKWAKNHDDVAALALEASLFIQVFAPVIRDSTPHLYLSAMPQIPSGSPLRDLWAGHLQNHLIVTLGHPTHWPATILTLHGHTSCVASVTYSPDGKYIVSGSWDRTIRIWNAVTGQCVADPFEGHTGAVVSVIYSPDGKHIISGSDDKTIRVWDAITGQCVAGPFEGHTEGVNSVALSPDGKYIVSSSRDNTIKIWNAVTGQSVAGPFEGHTDHIYSVAYSPDGNHIVSGSRDETIRVWNAITGQCVAGPFKGHTSWVHSVAYSPHGKHIVSGSLDNTVRVWNATTGQCVAGPFKGHTDQVLFVAYSPDGKHIVSGSADKTIRVWDPINGQCIAGPFEGHISGVRSVAYCPDGKHIVSGSEDNTIIVWNLAAGHCVDGQFERHTSLAHSFAYSPDGNYIVSDSSDDTIRIWDATTRQCVSGPFERHTFAGRTFAYSPDGSHIVSGSSNNTIRIWDPITGQCVAGPFEGHTNLVIAVAYSPDGKHVVSTSWDGTMRIWNAITGKCVANLFEGHTPYICCVVYSPDGKHIVYGDPDKTSITILDAITGQFVMDSFEGHTSLVKSVAYSPDGKHIASGSVDKTIRIWDAITGKCVAGPFEGHTDIVESVAYSPNGKHIVSGSWDKTVRIWNAITGQYVAGPFEGHTSCILSVAFSPDGDHIVSSSSDDSVKIWSLQTLHSFGEFYQKKSGWIELSSGASLCWIPPWGRMAFQAPTCSMILSPYQTYKIDIDNFLYGESWVSCWK